MSVQNTNAKYSEMLPVWIEMDDVCDGERKVKQKSVAYLPMICACDDAEENRFYYDSYLKRAVFYPIAKDTLNNNIGLAFSEDPSFDDDGLEFLRDDADGAGTSLFQQNQIALGYQLKYGRAGFFVDYPQVEGGVSKSDVVQKGIRPTVILYSAKNIINWRVRKIKGVFKTSLVVLLEESTQQDPGDEFKDLPVKTYRVLRLDEQDKYSIQVYTDMDGNLEAGDIQYPRNAKGSLWDKIPFIPVGSQSNDFEFDHIPIEPIVSVNLAHYRNSAEYEQSLFYAGQVQPVITELDTHDIELMTRPNEHGVIERKITLGSYAPLLLPVGANFQYVQAQESSIAKEGMTEKLGYMQLLGAKITESNEVAKTATQSDNEQMTKHSVLSLCVSNLNEAMENVLTWVAEYHGSGYNAKFTIKQDFAKGKLGLDWLKLFESLVVSGLMSHETFWQILTTGKIPEIVFKDEVLRLEMQKLGITE